MNNIPLLGPKEVPAVISMAAWEMPGGAGLVSLRDALIVAATHAILSRESSTLAPAGHVAGVIVGFVDQILVARAGPSTGSASSAARPSAVQEG